MQQLVCGECRKRYDYDREEFCPRCGAYNPPKKTWGVDAKGNVVRVDGVNEKNHAGSFVHREVHAEKATRRRTGLDWQRRTPLSSQERKRNSPLKVALIVLFIILFFNFVLPILLVMLA